MASPGSAVSVKVVIICSIALACGLIGLMALQLAFSPKPPQPIADRFDITIPNSDLTPTQIVAMQIESMKASADDPDQLVACYSLASPGNRELTGPFERFASLLREEPYIQLATCADFQMGPVEFDHNSAIVPVTLTADDGQETAFTFILVKQTFPPYRGCWMTDAVFPAKAAGE